jgi:hypothetical protein
MKCRLTSGEGIAKRKMEFGFEIGAALWRTPAALSLTTATPTAATEHSAQQITEVSAFEVESSRALVESATPAAKAHATHWVATYFVVLGALGFITNHVVGGGDLLELLFCCSVTGIRIGVEFPSELSVRARDVLGTCRFRHTEDFVVVLLEPLALWSHF